MKCLVVDPSTTLRRVVRKALQSLGADAILEATDAKQALALADASLDVLVTEWNLPGTSGLELVRQLRADAVSGRARVLMVTTRNLRSDVTEAVSVGVDGYLLKPFTPEALRAKLDELIAPPESEQQDQAA